MVLTTLRTKSSYILILFEYFKTIYQKLEIKKSKTKLRA